MIYTTVRPRLLKLLQAWSYLPTFSSLSFFLKPLLLYTTALSSVPMPPGEIIHVKLTDSTDGYSLAFQIEPMRIAKVSQSSLPNLTCNDEGPIIPLHAAAEAKYLMKTLC